MSKKEVKQVTESMYDIIKFPVITEKSMRNQESNKFTFRVAKDVSKGEVKDAVEAVFNVQVKTVNTITTPGKSKRFRGHMGKRQDYKKAVVTLVEGQNIDFTTGI